MIDIDVTYNVRTMEGEEGETCTMLTIGEAAYMVLTGKLPDDALKATCTAWLEQALTALEALRGRDYISGSIKDIRKVT